MKTFEKLDLGKNQKYIDEYLKNLSHFIEIHHQDKEVYNDIQEMIYEKLSGKKEISESIIKNILKDIGKPEDIFDLESEERKEKNFGKFYEKMQTSGYERENGNAIFLGISHMIARKLEIHVFWVRIIWIVLIFLFGFGIGLYLLVGIILPIKNKDYKNISLIKYFWNQFWSMITDLIKNTLKTLLKLPTNIFFMLKKYLGGVIGKIFYMVLSLVFLFILIGFIVILGAKVSRFSLFNYEFLALMPTMLTIGVTLSILWSFIFLSMCIYKVFGKNKIHMGIFYTGLVLGFTSLFLGITGGLQMISIYSQKQVYIENKYISLKDIDVESIDIDFSQTIIGDPLTTYPYVEIFPSENDDISLVLKKSYFINDENYDRIKDFITPLELSIVNNRILVQRNSQYEFNKKVPFVFFDYAKLELYLPTDKYYTFSGYYTHIGNTNISKDYDYLSDYIYNGCSYREIYFSSDEDGFLCEVDENDLKNARKIFIRSALVLVDDFDELTPIQHKDEFKRYYDYGLDWNIEYLEILDDKIILHYSDRSLKIVANMRYVINKETKEVIFSDFEIVDIEVNENYDDMYYKNPDIIYDFLEK